MAGGRSREVTSTQECCDGKGFSRDSLGVGLWAVTKVMGPVGMHTLQESSVVSVVRIKIFSLSDPEEMVRQPQGDGRDGEQNRNRDTIVILGKQCRWCLSSVGMAA